MSSLTHDEPLPDLHGQLSGLVLVVDDEESNRTFLRILLEESGHRVLEAADGEEALRLASAWLPDVVLLDLNMPRMDGFQACRRLKAEPRTAPIPVLLVTGLTDRESRHAGIEAGANDFLNKPYDAEDLALRVRNAVYSRMLYRRIERDYERLAELTAMRDRLMRMIGRDIRSPLLRAELALNSLREILAPAGAGADTRAARQLRRALAASREVTMLVDSMLDVGRLEQGRMLLNRSRLSLQEIAGEALAWVEPAAPDGSLSLEAPEEPIRVDCDGALVARVLAGLLLAALADPPGAPVRVALRESGPAGRISVSGRGVPAAAAAPERPPSTEAGEAEEPPAGALAVALCRLAAEAHGGEIGAEDGPGGESILWFTLPAGGTDEEAPP